MARKTCRAIDVVLYNYYVEFYYRTAHGGVDTSEPFDSIGNYGIGKGMAEMLETLGHDVRYIDETDPEE